MEDHLMNIFSDVKDHLPEEEFLELASSETVKIERIVSMGHRSPEQFWYDQENNEWVLVLAGCGVIEFEDGRVVALSAGDYLNIPARQKHRVKETSSSEPTVWLAVHYK
jgi:cupin 2 domain-containing protein